MVHTIICPYCGLAFPDTYDVDVHTRLDMAFFREAMNRARRHGDRVAASHWSDRLNDLIYKCQAARDRSVQRV